MRPLTVQNNSQAIDAILTKFRMRDDPRKFSLYLEGNGILTMSVSPFFLNSLSELISHLTLVLHYRSQWDETAREGRTSTANDHSAP